MTIKLPPHAISTDHPESPARQWSASELSWIAARDKVFLAHVKDVIEAYKQQQGEAVMWQYRWLNPGDNPSPQQSLEEAWKEVEPLWSGTVAEKVAELEAYRYIGKPVYECRALYTNPAPAPQPLSDEQDRALCEAYCNTASDAYFQVRPSLDSAENRRIFYAGHRIAWIEYEAAHGIGGEK